MIEGEPDEHPRGIARVPIGAGYAVQFAAKLLPFIRELQASGVTESRAIARELERRGIRTSRGGDWPLRRSIDVELCRGMWPALYPESLGPDRYSGCCPSAKHSTTSRGRSGPPVMTRQVVFVNPIRNDRAPHVRLFS